MQKICCETVVFMSEEISVYMFLGFLESGKTKFIQETLEDERMENGEKTLLLVCEEGEEEYDPHLFKVKNVAIEYLENEADLTQETLNALARKHRCDRVLVEYNGTWLLQSFFDAMPEDWERVLTLVQRHPPMTLRVNLRKTTPEAYRALLARQNLASVQTGAEALTLASPVPVTALPGFAEGLVSVQDAGTQLAAHLLPVRPGDRVLDACAAPGGKTAHLLERCDCEVTALEIDPKRAEKIRDTLDRLGLSAELVTTDAARTEKWFDGRPFDAVLLDAPCTASGIVRRQPDVPWIRRPEDIASLARQQRRLLRALWPVLKSGGHLLYCTCSVFPEEGPEQIRAFLEANEDAELVPLGEKNEGMMPLFPREEPWTGDEKRPGIHDGFFYALIRKK